MARVHMQLGSVYRRMGAYDTAYHHFLLVFRGKAGGLPEPLTPYHILLELAVTCEMKAAVLAEGSSVNVSTALLAADVPGAGSAAGAGRGGGGGASDFVVSVFDSAPTTVEACVSRAREGYKWVPPFARSLPFPPPPPPTHSPLPPL